MYNDYDIDNLIGDIAKLQSDLYDTREELEGVKNTLILIKNEMDVKLNIEEYYYRLTSLLYNAVFPDHDTSNSNIGYTDIDGNTVYHQFKILGRIVLELINLIPTEKFNELINNSDSEIERLLTRNHTLDTMSDSEFSRHTYFLDEDKQEILKMLYELSKCK